MITEDYVSFETAKLLKGKGFNEFTYSYYSKNDEESEPKLCTENLCSDNWNGTPDEVNDLWFSAPTPQMAMKWLREVHNILLVVDYDYEFTSTSYIYKIYRLVENGRPERVIVKGTSYDKDNNPTEHIVSSRDYERSAEEYATYQQAAEAGIRYCLESLT